MMVTHELEITCKCPVDDTLDRYHVMVSVNRVLPVEDIIAAVADLPPREYQENLTDRLARVLGARVVSVGIHSGVTTRCYCP